MYTYTYISIYVYNISYTYIYIYIHVMCIYIYVCTYVIYICIHIHMLYIYTYVIYIHICYIHIHMIYIYVYKSLYIYIIIYPLSVIYIWHRIAARPGPPHEKTIFQGTTKSWAMEKSHMCLKWDCYIGLLWFVIVLPTLYTKIYDFIYPLVNCHKKLWKDPPFCSWENPLFLWSFSIAMLVYQRVYW